MRSVFSTNFLAAFVATLVCFSSKWAQAEENQGPVLPNQYQSPTPGQPLETPYWKRFNDPVLAKLVKKGLEGNFDIAAAKHRIIQAEAVAKQALAPLLPSISAEASWSVSPYDSMSTMGGTTGAAPTGAPTTGGATSTPTPDTIHSFTTVLKANYLVDISGRYYVSRQAALVEAAASREDAQTQAANLVTLIVQTYYDLVTAKIRFAMVEEQIANSEGLLKLVETRFRTGASNALDVLQQRQQLEATKSQLPLVRALIFTAEQQLATLIGESSPKALPAIETVLPPLTDAPSLGTPDRLLTARPELRAATKRLDALSKKEKGAVRTLLPSLSLFGQVGYRMRYLDEIDLDDYWNETWNLGITLSVPIYQGGGNWAALDQVRAAKRSASSALQQSAINALQQVEIAIINEQEQRERLKSLREQLASAELTLSEARKRYLVGLSDYLNVLASLGTFQGVQLNVLQAERDVISARIQLLSALGGEWTKQLVSTQGVQP